MECTNRLSAKISVLLLAHQSTARPCDRPQSHAPLRLVGDVNRHHGTLRQRAAVGLAKLGRSARWSEARVAAIAKARWQPLVWRRLVRHIVTRSSRFLHLHRCCAGAGGWSRLPCGSVTPILAVSAQATENPALQPSRTVTCAELCRSSGRATWLGFSTKFDCDCMHSASHRAGARSAAPTLQAPHPQHAQERQLRRELAACLVHAVEQRRPSEAQQAFARLQQACSSNSTSSVALPCGVVASSAGTSSSVDPDWLSSSEWKIVLACLLATGRRAASFN